MVAYNMCQWRTFVHLCKTAPKSDIFVLVVTFVLTVVFDLVVAIEAGMIMACVLFMKRMSDESGVSSWKYYDPEEDPVITARKAAEAKRALEAQKAAEEARKQTEEAVKRAEEKKAEEEAAKEEAAKTLDAPTDPDEFMDIEEADDTKKE